MTGFIPNLKRLIKTGQVQEAKEALTQLIQRPDEDQHGIIEALALASDKTALDLLSFLMDKVDQSHPFHLRLFQLATDRAHLNYSFALILLDHADLDQLRQITPLLKHILAKETQGDLLNRILRIAGKRKLESMVDDVAEFIFYDDPDLKQEAVKALERIGTLKAMKRLEQVAETDKCDLDILDALDMLKKNLVQPLPQAKNAVPVRNELISNTELLTAKHLEDRHQAYTYFSDQGHRVAQALHANMETQNPDLMINLLRLAARTIPQEALGDLLTLAARKDVSNPVKFSVFTALAHFPELESAASIVNAVTDPTMYIRMAAVKALDRHCSDYIIAEIKNKIESGTKTGETLGVTILDTKAANLIDSLMNSDTFSYVCSNYLERNAPAQVIDAYIGVLENRNRISTIKKYSRLRLEKAKQDKPFIVVIHPNTTFLDIYTKLIHGCGFNVRTFTGPQEAFESIVFEKPAAVVCDLFVGKLTALDLAKEIRELYPLEAVPIIVSSLQKSLDPDHLKKQFKAAGINGFYPFPAKPSQIKSWAGAN